MLVGKKYQIRTVADYERSGYVAMSKRTGWWLSDCPYRAGWRRAAWQKGAWRYICEQRAAAHQAGIRYLGAKLPAGTS